MPRERKTIDVWEIYFKYAGGWEHELTEFTRRAALQQKRVYNENTPYPVKIVKKREPKSNYDASQLADIAKQVAKCKQEAREERKRRNPLPS